MRFEVGNKPLDLQNLIARGELGDAYLYICILYNPKRKGSVLVKHCLGGDEKTEKTWPLVQQIYSLSSNVEPYWISVHEWERTVSTCGGGPPPGFRPSPIVCAKRGVKPVTPYPSFDFPTTEHDVGESYIACCPKGGRPRQSHRAMLPAELPSIVENYPDHNFVLVGGDKAYADFSRPNVLNLIGKTSLLEAMGIVARATGFIGVQGLMSYVAMSQKVQSVVYARSIGHLGAFYGRMSPEWVGYCTLYINSLKEDPELFTRFMETCL